VRGFARGPRPGPQEPPGGFWPAACHHRCDLDVHIPRCNRGRCARARGLTVATSLLLLGLLGGVTSQGWSEDAADASAAAVSRHRPYCTRHRHPHGCIAVPTSAKRPRKVSQQGPKALTPSDVVNGGGLGGGPGNHRDTALSWARTQRNLKRWAWHCERFVEEAYGTRGAFSTAAAAAPPGSLVYFAADSYNQRYGHVGLSMGRGKVISALTRVTITDVTRSPYWRHLYLGWADAPKAWPGRIPPPPGPTTTDPATTVRFTAPAFGQTVSGTVALMATAGYAGGVAFDAYYAADPRDPTTRGWHSLGAATPQGDSWTLDWNTASTPDQGYGPWGTVTVAVTALDARGQRTGTRDYRTPPAVTAPPATGTPEPITTYPETTGGSTNTWTNYTNAGGTHGETIPANTTVQITCRLPGLQVDDGNTWWYRIATSPWNNAYHASADAFYNNGQTTGSLHGTPFFDPVVPTCP
jgi:hypothetical protein